MTAGINGSVNQSVQLLSSVQLFMTLWTAAFQASLSITNSQSLLKLMPIESVMPSNHLILSHPLLLCPQSFPASESFQMSQLFISGGQSIRVSASTSVLPMNTQDWSPLGYFDLAESRFLWPFGCNLFGAFTTFTFLKKTQSSQCRKAKLRQSSGGCLALERCDLHPTHAASYF